MNFSGANLGFPSSTTSAVMPQQTRQLNPRLAMPRSPSPPPQSLDQTVFSTFNAGAAGANAAAGADPGSLATTSMAPYMNPYTQQVIDGTVGELNRQESIQQQGVDDAAQAQNAFGGDRMQIQKAAMNRDFDVTRKNAISDLYKSNFDNAQRGAMFDVNNAVNRQQHGMDSQKDWANMGFGWGSDMQQQNLTAGALQQQQQQAIMDAMRKQWESYTGQGDTNINRLTGATANPGSSGTTTGTSTPSIAGIATRLLGF